MRQAALLAVVVLLPVAGGCLSGGETPDSWAVCETGYYVGCDENPDALRLRDEFGLFQITNTTERIGHGRPRLAEETVTWTEGGFGRPLTVHAFRITQSVHLRQGPSQEFVTHSEYPAEKLVAFTQSPSAEDRVNGSADHNHSRALTWLLESNTTISKAKPFDGALISTATRDALDWPWMLLLEFAPTQFQHGVIAYNLESGAWVRLEDVKPSDGSPYGGPLLSYVLSEGSAFLGYSHEQGGTVESTLVEVVLETGERIERDRWTGSPFIHMRGSENYVVYDRPWEGTHRVVAYDRAADRVIPLDVDADGGAEWVRVGREWIVYPEPAPGPFLVAYHMPTGARHVIVEDTDLFRVLDYDIDEPWIAVKIDAKLDANARTELRFNHTQLYLYEMPD